jgi:DNA replication and repair protein RecF
LLLEAEIVRQGRNRAQVNHQPLRRARDLLGALRVSVFAPDDLVLVKCGPAERRRFLDETVVAAAPKLDVLRVEVDRILRQRNALLKQAGGRLGDDVAVTLEVWDDKLAAAGTELGDARQRLVDRLGPVVASSYQHVARHAAAVVLTYHAPWREHPDGLAGALRAARADDMRRGVSTVGPHRDDVEVGLEGLAARTHASQGEQRSLALALRLGAHAVVTDAAGTPPVLLLDDVFSELDPGRCQALLEALPPGQTLLTTAAAIPPDAHPDLRLRVQDGQIRPEP